MITDSSIYLPEEPAFSLDTFSAIAYKNGFRRLVVCKANAAALAKTNDNGSKKTDDDAKTDGANSDVSKTKLCDIVFGTRISAKTTKELISSLRRVPKGNVVIVDVGDNGFNRTAITTKGVHLLAGLDALPKAGFEHITSEMARKHNVGLVIELGKIIDPRTRRSALSHYADILKLHRKYRFPLVIATSATSPAGQRNLTETIALCSLFGMERAEVYAALNALDSIINPPKTVEVVE